jgi:hypothetical protein
MRFSERKARDYGHLGKKTIYCGGVQSQDRVYEVLTMLLPYLRVKKARALELLHFIEDARRAKAA